MPLKGEAKRRYMRRYMRRVRRELRAGEKGKVLSKGGDLRGGLGRGGEQELLDLLLDLRATSEQASWAVEQVKLLQGRVTLLEADRALLEALVRQAEEWSA